MSVAGALAQSDTSAVANGSLAAPDEATPTPPPQTPTDDIESRPVGGKADPGQARAAVAKRPGIGVSLSPVTRTLAALGAVILLVLVAARWVKPLLSRMKHVQGGDMIEVLGRAYLSPKQALCLVRVGRRIHLLGVSAERIVGLGQVEDPGEVAELLCSSAAGRPDSVSRQFEQLLQGRVADLEENGRVAANDPIGTAAERTSQALGRLRRRLRGLTTQQT
jgi:flagellar biogenesis protein FliO